MPRTFTREDFTVVDDLGPNHPGSSNMPEDHINKIKDLLIEGFETKDTWRNVMRHVR